MTAGSATYDRRYSEAPWYGYLGHYQEKTWNGLDSPKVKKTPRKRVRIVTSRFLANRHGKSTLIIWTSKFPVMGPERPVKRSRSQENPYTMNFFKRKEGTFVTTEVVPRYFTTHGAGYSAEAFAGSNAASALNVLGKLRNAVAGSDFNAGVTLGEGREGIKMIGDTARRIYQAMRHAKRGRWIEARRVLVKNTYWDTKKDEKAFKRVMVRPGRDISQNWLELQYGWLPLIKDVENAAQFAAHHYNVPLQKVVRVTSASKEELATATSGPVSPAEVVTLQKVSIKAILREKDVVQLSGVTDPLSIAWELTPYSFVIDWFIPIGNWLQARALAQGISGTFVTSTKNVATVKGLKSGVAWHPDIPEYEHHKVSFSRAVDYSLPVPYAEFKPFAKAASVGHAINALALLVGVGGTKSLNK